MQDIQAPNPTSYTTSTPGAKEIQGAHSTQTAPGPRPTKPPKYRGPGHILFRNPTQSALLRAMAKRKTTLSDEITTRQANINPNHIPQRGKSKGNWTFEEGFPLLAFRCPFASHSWALDVLGLDQCLSCGCQLGFKAPPPTLRVFGSTIDRLERAAAEFEPSRL